MSNDKKYHYIYKTTNLVNGKYYIGMHSTNNMDDGYYGSGKILLKSIEKYGVENHRVEIMENLPDRVSLVNREKELVNESVLSDDNCMNLMVGGEGGFISVEQQRDRSIAGSKGFIRKLRTDKKFKEEHSKRSSQNLKKAHKDGKIKYDNFIGRKHKEESKKKIGETNSIKQKGEKNSQYGTCWITRDGQNKKIKKEELSEYTSQGWVKGRVIKRG